MFCSKRFVCLALISFSVLANQVHAGKFSPSTEVQENIKILIETRNCPQCDLSGANLSRFDLSGANLDGVNLSRSKLTLANLSGANLQNADLREANFAGADLANTDMRGADLTGTIFVGAYMVGALMDGQMINTKPYASDDISDVEESVYVEDTVKSKKPQETEEMTIGTRRDFDETPPVVPAIVIGEKATIGKEVVDPVTNVTFAYKEKSNKMLPSQSAVAPDAKVAPAISEVRILEDGIVPEDLPEIVETKKDLVPEASTKVFVGKAPQVEGTLLVNEAFAEASEAEVDTPVYKDSENGEKVLPAEVETEANVEAVNLPLEPMEVVVVETIKQENEGVEEESTQSLDLTEEATEGLTKEEESKGIVQSVLNIFTSAEPSTEVLRNAAILLDSNSCYGCDLQGVNLSGENLDGADLEGANLSNAILKDIDLEGANLKGANLSGVDLSGADLSEADLYKADLSGANLSDANLGKALLDDVNLTGVIGDNSPGILLLDAE